MMIEACVGGMLRSNRRRRVGEIATRLGILVQYLDTLPPYWIDPDIEQQCKRLLKELLLICIVRHASPLHYLGKTLRIAYPGHINFCSGRSPSPTSSQPVIRPFSSASMTLIAFWGGWNTKRV